VVVKLFDTYVPGRTLLLMISETLLVFSAMIAAVFLRFGTDAEFSLSYEYGFLKVVAVSALCVLCLYYFDLYDSAVLGDPREVLIRLIEVLGIVSLIAALLYYLYPAVRLGRGSFLTGILLVGLSLAASREVFFVLNRSARFADRAVILGDGPLARSLATEVKGRPELGIRLVGYVSLPSLPGSVHVELPFLGGLEDLPALVRQKNVKRIMVAIKDRRGSMPMQDLLDLRLQGLSVEDGGKLLERISGKIEVDQLYPSWLIFSEGFRLRPSVLVMQRSIGIVVSIILLLVVLPIIPLVVLLIKATSNGPVLYRQQRVGRRGKIFYCYKFRTMRDDAEADTGPTWACDGDPRITRVGRFLRLVRLDEIPQLWNVLRGDMNFVGPRPERPEFDDWLKREIPYYSLRQVVRPGITGWAQISYSYGASVEQAKEKMRYDLYYIKNMSLSLDLLVIFQTIKTVIFGRGAQ
jgi:sugar transferase (PEP-CTERM system associated)